MSPATPLIISFYTSDAYYRDQGEFFERDCHGLGLDYHLETVSARDWIDACAYKVRFIQRCLRQFGRPVVWIDVDSRIIGNPTDFIPDKIDFAAYPRNFRHLNNLYLSASRFWAPSIQYFNNTQQALGFVDTMVEFSERQSQAHTDDYLLHKAWIECGRNLAAYPIPPKYVTAYGMKVFGPDTRVLLQFTGRAKEGKHQALQHSSWASANEAAAAGTPGNRKRVFSRSSIKRKWQPIERRVRSARNKILGNRPSQRALPAFWYGGKESGNFGDILTPFILRDLFNVRPKLTAPDKGPALLGIGSIARLAGSDSTIWGSGAASIANEINPGARVLAARGPLTSRIIERGGGTKPTVLGDPGILATELFPHIERKVQRKFGLIPHVAHEEPLKAVSSDRLERFCLISMNVIGKEGIRRAMEQIAECEVIFSSSLHGLVTAHALGVPAASVFAPPPYRIISGYDFKFRDYCASVGIEFEFLNLEDVLAQPAFMASRCVCPPDNVMMRQRNDLRAVLEDFLADSAA